MRVLNLEMPTRVPIRSWASQAEDDALRQAANVANLPFVISHVALMPDAHPGYGVPIGAVFSADNAIVPYAVGVDIGCGVSLTKMSLSADEIGTKLQQVLDGIAVRVPVGNGPGAQHESEVNVFDWPSVTGIDPSVHALSEVLSKAIRDARTQLGSLGGGNHFIEIQRDETGGMYFMLHSGSRSVGKKVCDYWHKVALALNQKWFSALPDNELAYLPWSTDEARGYFADMTVAMEWAEQNRSHMERAIKNAMADLFPAVTFQKVTDIHHNYAAWENHHGRNGIVHRKGAVRAREGETVLIPGSMGTASYAGEGLGSEDSFMSCQHGAGRARSRSATLKMETDEQFAASMSGILMGGKARNARDESPFAYKDIEGVMADSADLVRPITRLTPLGVVKG